LAQEFLLAVRKKFLLGDKKKSCGKKKKCLNIFWHQKLFILENAMLRTTVERLVMLKLRV